MRRVFVVVLALNGLLAALFGANTLLNFEGALDGFGMAYTDEARALGAILGMQFFLQAAVLFMAISWVRQPHRSGIWIGYAVGFYLVLLSLVSLLWAGNTLALTFDAPRGVLLLVFGALASRQMTVPSPAET